MKTSSNSRESSKKKNSKIPTTTNKNTTSSKKILGGSKSSLASSLRKKLTTVKSVLPAPPSFTENKTKRIGEGLNASPLLETKEESSKSIGKPKGESQLDPPKDQKPTPTTNASSHKVVPIIPESRYAELVKRADRAILAGKTFASRHYYNIVRTALLKRGWVELAIGHMRQKPTNKRTCTYENLIQRLPAKKNREPHSDYIKRCEYYALSCLVEHKPVGILWTFRRNEFDQICYRNNPSILTNKLINVPFATKGGLLRQFRNLNWIWKEGLAEVYFPRSYFASSSSDLAEFTNNFRSTACISFLKIVQKKSKLTGWTSVFQTEGEIPFKMFDFALTHCYQLLNSFHNNDIDLEFPNLSSQQDWDVFLSHYKLLTVRDVKIQLDNREIAPILKNLTIILGSVKSIWPQFELDGCHNMWIVKPSLQNCGRGLVIKNSISEIIHHVSKPNRHDIIQKYIEIPLLIHNTKFDIRQWFIVTSVKPLTIWMYKENYLRFSSQMFDLTSRHESVHFTNHCIQRKYEVSSKRDGRLPKTNMWDSNTFKAYLRQMGKPEIYYKRIYPGFKTAIIATLLASQPNMSKTTNAFELFGADFVLGEDFTPWLLEINSCPDLARSTSVTARLVPKLIDDLLKVIIDRKSNPQCNVGNFELIYQQKWPSVLRDSSGPNLEIKAQQIPAKSEVFKKSEKQFLSDGEILSPIDSIRREMYYHLVHKNPGKQYGPHLTSPGIKPFGTFADNARELKDKLNLLLHFTDTNPSKGKMVRTFSKSAIHEKLMGIHTSTSSKR